MPWLLGNECGLFENVRLRACLVMVLPRGSVILLIFLSFLMSDSLIKQSLLIGLGIQRMP